MTKDSNENLPQDDSQEEDIEPNDINENIEEDIESDDNNEDIEEDIESNDDNEDIDVDDNNTASADKEADIGKFEQPQTYKLTQKNLPLIFIGLAALGAIVIAYFWISDSKSKKSNIENKIPFEQEKPDTETKIPVPVLQKSSSEVPKNIAAVEPPAPPITTKASPVKTPTPTVTKTKAVKAPTPPPVPELLSPDKITNPTSTDHSNISGKNKYHGNRRNTKMKSSIMLKNGGSSNQEQSKPGHDTIDSASAHGTFNPNVTKAHTSKLTKIGNMSAAITQGKILDAVLETPINTVYPGPIRAVISRDVFSERGTNILIPKGSRVVGTLKGGYTAGQTRVAVTWTRIILPSGYDIAITDAPGVGKLGMIGIEGIVNRQFIETIGNAALLSIINISAAKMVEDYFNIDSNTSISSTSSSGTITTTSSQNPTQQAAETAVTNLSNVTKDWLSKNFLVTPYIVINQGTRVKIFVNQDIRFPKNINTAGIIK